MRKIEVVPYNSEWPVLFEKEKKALLDLDIPTILGIHHIGSTAVEDLAAKPIIDILLEVDCLESLDQSQKKIEELGYESFGEFGIVGRRYYRKGKNIRSHQIHAFLASDPHSSRHIAFRVSLRVKCTSNLRVKVHHFWDVQHHKNGSPAINQNTEAPRVERSSDSPRTGRQSTHGKALQF